MEIGKTLYVTTRKKWHAWLAHNHKTAREIWLIYYKKGSGKPRISYDDAVLEALAFGWIDSIAKSIDDERFAQRFSPRRHGSSLSQMNRERVRELIRNGKMTPSGLAAIAHVYNPTTDTKEKFVMPPGILKAIKANRDAWKYFQTMPEAYRRIRVAYIESRKRHSMGMYKNALANFVKMTAQNKRIGYVKERK